MTSRLSVQRPPLSGQPGNGGMSTRYTLYATAFLRAVATGATGVLLGVHLAREGLSARSIGTVVSAGLAGAAVAAVVATLRGDHIGRRRFLILLSLVGAAGTLGLVASHHPAALAACSFVGMLNGMGRDRGAALVLEQAALPATTSDAGRTRVIAWYTMLQDIGHAAGSLLAGLPSLLARTPGWTEPAAGRATLAATAALGLACAVLYVFAGRGLDAGAGGARLRVSPRTRAILTRISALFAIDSLAGGFLTTALLSYFFFQRFGASDATIGLLFFGARVMNAASHLAAAWLARRIGLVPTMVFTHIPSSLLLITVAFAPSFGVAAVLFLLREGLVEMDVPTRQSYVLAVVEPGERTFATGVTHLVRLGCWAVAPVFAGRIMDSASLGSPLILGAAMKITYDLLLWRAFRGTRPPEESGGGL
jgi:MFS family permease